MKDGNLRTLFRSHMPEGMWVSVESGDVSAGIPDSHYIFPGGNCGWIEFKRGKGKRKISVGLRPMQVAWLERYSRLGGTAFVAVRTDTGLYLVSAGCARDLAEGRLLPLVSCLGAPAVWDWAAVRRALDG